MADPPTVGLGAALTDDAVVGRSLRLRNVSGRPLAVDVDVEGASNGAVALSVTPDTIVLGQGRSAEIAITAAVPVLPSAPGGLAGVLRIRVEKGDTLRVPWAIAVPVTGKPLLAGVTLSSASFAPSDATPSVLSLVAGRVDGRAERPQLLPLRTLSIELYRRERRVGTLVRIRDVLPGRYAFGVTGRGPRGARLPKGAYELRIVATPVAGAAQVTTVPFAIR